MKICCWCHFTFWIFHPKKVNPLAHALTCRAGGPVWSDPERSCRWGRHCSRTSPSGILHRSPRPATAWREFRLYPDPRSPRSGPEIWTDLGRGQREKITRQGALVRLSHSPLRNALSVARSWKPASLSTAPSPHGHTEFQVIVIEYLQKTGRDTSEHHKDVGYRLSPEPLLLLLWSVHSSEDILLNNQSPKHFSVQIRDKARFYFVWLGVFCWWQSD